MMFSYVHKKTMRPAIQQPANNNNIGQSMVFGTRQRHVAIPMTPAVEQQQQQQANQPILPKMKWGRPIWTFFHVLSKKIKDEYFNLVINDFFRFVSLICSALPCPVCSAHASQYIKSINFKNIKNKEDLINFFFVFHNAVNQRKGYVVLQKDNIPAYETANTIAVIKNFVLAFEDKSRSMKLMADDLARARISAQFKTWINQNIQYFDP
jgi:hypothetical protein